MSQPKKSGRVEVETVSIRLPAAPMDAIRAHCAEHANAGKMLGMQPPNVSSVIRQLVEEQFGGDAGKVK